MLGNNVLVIATYLLLAINVATLALIVMAFVMKVSLTVVQIVLSSKTKRTGREDGHP
jgi:hypothetical protein